MKTKKTRKMRLYKVLYIILICVMLFSGYKLFQYAYASKTQEKLNEELRQEFYVTESEAPEENRFDGLKDINRDIVGWLYVDGTKVDYPVLQASNNDFYLRRNVLKEYALHGSIYMDESSQRDASGLHTVIYGHNMKDGSMFGSLSKLKQKSEFEKNRIIVYEHPDGITEWEIFSIYIYKPTDKFFRFEISDEEDFEQYVLECAGRSMHGPAEIGEIPDRMLTLMTCTYEVYNSRLVIHAKSI